MLVVDDFEVADGGLAAGAPVDDVCAAIDEPLLVKTNEGFSDRNRQALVHGEVFSPPVDRCAEALHLVENCSAVVATPLPYAPDKGFAAHLLAAGALLGQLALDHHLRGDAGVIGSGQPQSETATHAPPAGQNIHLRLVKHVAHVQAAGHVGRRQQNRKRLAGGALVLVGCSGRGHGEELFADPVFGPVIFNGGGVVGFGQVVRHEGSGATPGMCAWPLCCKGFERGDHFSL